MSGLSRSQILLVSVYETDFFFPKKMNYWHLVFLLKFVSLVCEAWFLFHKKSCSERSVIVRVFLVVDLGG